MSGNPQLDMQIARAVQPQFNMNQAIQQMQRPAVQMPVQNPIFGGAIPMDFGLPQAAQIPAGYTNPLMSFKPAPFTAQPSQSVAAPYMVQGGYDSPSAYMPGYSMGYGDGA
jgi:hypothetical protein